MVGSKQKARIVRYRNPHYRFHIGRDHLTFAWDILPCEEAIIILSYDAMSVNFGAFSGSIVVSVL